jgi:thiamine biosynthesis protein ThiS
MRVLVNGKELLLDGPSTVADLLAELGVPRDGTAVIRVGQVVPSSEHATTDLDEGDVIDVVRLVGGG